MPMLSDMNFISSSKLSPPYLPIKKIRIRQFRPTLAKKPNITETPTTNRPVFPLRVSKALIARAAVAVCGLGFLDAGYSGDWSRIGVISRETEELLKVAAYLIVPLCIFVIYSVSGGEGGGSDGK